MALKGIDIFKLTPKKNCKECGSPTCMAFAMKVAQGAADIAACPYMSDDAKAQLSEATAYEPSCIFPKQSGLNPNGSLTAISFEGDITASE